MEEIGWSMDLHSIYDYSLYSRHLTHRQATETFITGQSMKKLTLLCLALLLTPGLCFANDAELAGLEVMGAQYNPSTDEIDVAVKYKGGDGDLRGIEILGCDALTPRTCRANDAGRLGSLSNEDIEGVISVPRPSLEINKLEFSKATLVIQGPGKKSKATIVLPMLPLEKQTETPASEDDGW